jgi:hypothetical protein
MLFACIVQDTCRKYSLTDVFSYYFLLCTAPKHTPTAGLDAVFACSAEQPRFEAVDGCESA